MRIVPIKSFDVVQYANEKYVVSSVQLTKNGPIAVLQKINEVAQIVHVSEITLIDNTETLRRAKSIGIDGISNVVKTDEIIKMPDTLTPKQKTEVTSIMNSFIQQIAMAIGDGS